MSRRAYARSRGVSEGAIRKHIRSGLLSTAITKDGKVDPERADKILASDVVRGDRVSASLAEARKRKAAASCALLQDEIDALSSTVVYAGDVAATVRAECELIARRIIRIADVAIEVAGRPPSLAAEIIQSHVEHALHDLSAGDDENEPGAEIESAGPRFGDMTKDQLETVKADLLAKRLEMRRQLNTGELVTIDSVTTAMAARLSTLRQNVLGLHVSTATHLEHDSPEQARELLKREIATMLSGLCCAHFPRSDLDEIVDGRNVA